MFGNLKTSKCESDVLKIDVNVFFIGQNYGLFMVFQKKIMKLNKPHFAAFYFVYN